MYCVFFNKLDTFTKVRLFKAYCSSMYGCELWALDNCAIDDFCIGWRKALRRILNIPYNSHSFLLPLVTDSLPVFYEMCRRSAKFIVSCCMSNSNVVRSIARYGLMARFLSVIGRNALMCCQIFGWNLIDFSCGNVPLFKSYFVQHANEGLSEEQIYSAVVLIDTINIRDGNVSFSNDDFALSRCDIDVIINFVATN